MEIIGACKKKQNPSTVYFCEYGREEYEIEWDKIVKFLVQCKFTKSLNSEDICCIAIESKDEMKTDKRLIGMIIYNGETPENIMLEEYKYFDYYFDEVAEEFKDWFLGKELEK